ncbi:MAG: hypothetical protein RLN62_03150 [Rickettsiales bacterium]
MSRFFGGGGRPPAQPPKPTVMPATVVEAPRTETPAPATAITASRESHRDEFPSFSSFRRRISTASRGFTSDNVKLAKEIAATLINKTSLDDSQRRSYAELGGKGNKKFTALIKSIKLYRESLVKKLNINAQQRQAALLKLSEPVMKDESRTLPKLEVGETRRGHLVRVGREAQKILMDKKKSKEKLQDYEEEFLREYIPLLKQQKIVKEQLEEYGGPVLAKTVARKHATEKHHIAGGSHVSPSPTPRMSGSGRSGGISK